MTPRCGRPDRGSQFLEFAFYLPLLLFIVVLALEVFLSFVAMERMHNAATIGARTASSHGIESAHAQVRNALPDWIEPESITVAINGDGGYYGEVTTSMPFFFPASGLDLSLTRRVDMPAL